jgi:hypothetical protein
MGFVKFCRLWLLVWGGAAEASIQKDSWVLLFRKDCGAIAADSEWVCWTLKDWEYNLLTDIRSKGREELVLLQQEKRGKEGWRWWHLWVGARIAAMPCSDVWTLVTRWVQTKSLLQATKKPIMFQFSGCVWEYTDHNMINFALDQKKCRSLPLPTCCL